MNQDQVLSWMEEVVKNKAMMIFDVIMRKLGACF